jgi:hypothetical protein
MGTVRRSQVFGGQTRIDCAAFLPKAYLSFTSSQVLLFILHIAYCIFVCENCGPEYFLPSIESSSNKGNPVLPSFMLY